MLLLAHMDRLEIPAILHKDLEYVLSKSAVFLEEIIKIANLPRTSPYGWLTPTIGAVEMLQCITQAVSIGSRKSFTQGKVKPLLSCQEEILVLSPKRIQAEGNEVVIDGLKIHLELKRLQHNGTKRSGLLMKWQHWSL